MFSTDIWSRLRKWLLSVNGRSRVVHPPFRYPEGRHGRGELRYVNGLPVLRLNGTPAELGEQAGILAVKPGKQLLRYPHDLLTFFLGSRLLSRLVFRRLLRIGRRMIAEFPEPYRRELDGLIGAGLPRELMIAANTMFDMKNLPVSGLFGCSSLIVDGEHSAAGGPLFGRNMDF